MCQVRNLGRGVTRLLGEYCSGQSHQAESLETHLLVALLLHVDKQLAVKVLALNKLLHTDGFQANTNKSKINGMVRLIMKYLHSFKIKIVVSGTRDLPDIMFLELGKDR